VKMPVAQPAVPGADDTLTRYATDPAAFMDDFVRLNEKGRTWRLSPYQRRVLALAFRRGPEGELAFRIVLWSEPKKSWKTFISAALVLWWAITNPNTEVIVVANDRAITAARRGALSGAASNALAEQFDLGSKLARLEASRVAAAWTNFEAATRALDAIRRVRASGRGRRPSARDVERAARRQGLADQSYSQALDRLRALAAQRQQPSLAERLSRERGS